MRFAIACFALGIVSACSGNQTSGPTPPGTSPDDAGTGSNDPAVPHSDTTIPGSFSVEFPPTVAPPGEEHTRCVVRRLGNANAMRVGQVHNMLSKGSHHLIVYQVSDTVERATPYDCRPFQDTFDPTKGAPLMITQKADDLLTLPEGVAYALGANQMIRLEMHYINPTAEDLTVSATSTMAPVDEAAFKYEADVLLIGSMKIDVPPKATHTLGPTYIKLPGAYSGANFFAITGHEHQYGTNVRVSTAANADAAGTPVYDVPDWTWSEPKTVFASPPFQVPQGGGFKLTCDWKNTSDKALGFGESAEDEMCFFWAYYYPRKTGGRVILQR